MKKFTFCLLLLLLSLGVDAQKRTQPKRTQPATVRTPRPTETPNTRPTQPKRLIEAFFLENGRVVSLYDDGTYDLVFSDKLPTFLNPTPINTAPSPSRDITVQVQGGVITGGGDVKPVARTEFTVFNGDITSTLATINDREGKPLDVFTFYAAQRFPTTYGDAYGRALEKVKPFIVGTFTTGFDGAGQIKLPKRSEPYYLYGYYLVGRSSCLWYLKFPGNESGSYVVDNKTSMYCR